MCEKVIKRVERTQEIIIVLVVAEFRGPGGGRCRGRIGGELGIHMGAVVGKAALGNGSFLCAGPFVLKPRVDRLCLPDEMSIGVG